MAPKLVSISTQIRVLKNPTVRNRPNTPNERKVARMYMEKPIINNKPASMSNGSPATLVPLVAARSQCR